MTGYIRLANTCTISVLNDAVPSVPVRVRLCPYATVPRIRTGYVTSRATKKVKLKTEIQVRNHMTRVKKQFAGLPSFFESILGCFGNLGYSDAQARKALETLCRKGEVAGEGFDPMVLAQLLLPLVYCGHHNVTKLAGPFHYGPASRDRLTRRDFKKMGKQLAGLKDLLEKLSRTAFGRYLADLSLLESGRVDFLAASKDLPSETYRFSVEVLDPLLEISAIALKWGNEKTPATDIPLYKLCRFVERTTGKPHYNELVDILQPFAVAHAQTPESLRVWRSRRKKAAAERQRRLR